MTGTNQPISLAAGREKCIVMPFRPGPDQSPDGIGLGLHFLAGNLMCLHEGLLECWFGWRVKKIFPETTQLDAYCSGKAAIEDMGPLGKQEKVRFWMTGEYGGFPEAAQLALVLHDTKAGQVYPRTVELDFSDHLTGFRTQFFDWLGETGLGFPGQEKGQWPERISPEGMDLLGRALESLYRSYVADGPLALEVFHRAADCCPESYLTQDLLGWGIYKNNEISGAARAFARAVALNPDGMGAFAGLMWCSLAREDRENTLKYALEKGRCRGEAPEKAEGFVAKKFS